MPTPKPTPAALSEAECLDRASMAMTRLVMYQPFFGMLALRLTVVVTDKVERAATDGVNIFINPTFAATLSKDEWVGVVAHEVFHCAMLHPFRRGDREHQEWNMSCDYAINPLIKEQGMVLPPDHLDDPKYHGKSAEDIYATHPKPPKNGSCPSCVKDPRSSPDAGKGKGKPSPGSGPPDQQPGSGMSQEEAEALEQDWQVATAQAAQAATMAGRGSPAIDRVIKETRPRVPWEHVLRDFLTTAVPKDQTFARPNRKQLALGVIMPGYNKELTGKIVVGIDTSGSINEDMLNSFAAELRDIIETIRPDLVTVIGIDDRVQAEVTFETGEQFDLPKVKKVAKGHGGTDFGPLFDHVFDKGMSPDAIVYLTDLEGPCEPKHRPTCPVLWAVFNPWNDHLKNPPFGTVLKVDLKK